MSPLRLILASTLFILLWLLVPSPWNVAAALVFLVGSWKFTNRTPKTVPPLLKKSEQEIVKPVELPKINNKVSLSRRGARYGRTGASTHVMNLYKNYGGSLPFRTLRDSNFNFDQWQSMYPIHAADFIAFGLYPDITEETKNCVYMAAEDELT